jgi:transcriptional regulator GlxA family with amidase domain
MDIVIALFDRLTALDAIGPYEVLSRIPGARVQFAGKSRGPIATDNRFLTLMVDTPLSEIERADLLLWPGGFGTRALERDEEVLDWTRRIHTTTTKTTSVCTGSLVLGAAGLLRGLEATTHWAVLPRLAEFGARPVSRRVVPQGKVVTSAGVSSGIDMALQLVAELVSEERAQAIQLALEYDPEPPFQAGSPQKAPAAVREKVREAIVQRLS